jgi:hypothetical protein
MGEKGVFVRYDEGRKEYVLTLCIPGVTELETSNGLLSDAFKDMAEQLEGEGL